MQKAFSYQRFSHPRQVNEHRLWAQLNQARQYCLDNDLLLDHDLSFQDLGVSAFRGKNRKVGRLGDFLLACRHGLVERGSYLLVESLDRISRDAARRALRTLEDICDEGITVVTLMDNQTYTAESLDKDPASLLFSLVVFLRANEESERKRQWQKAAWARKAERARNGEKVIISRRVPGWLRIENDEFVIVPEKVEVVKFMFRAAEVGMGRSVIATTLNRRGMPTLGGSDHWYNSNVQAVLVNPSVIGTFIPHTFERIDGIRQRVPGKPIPKYFPQIISKKQWNAVQEQIAERRTKYSGPKEPGMWKLRNVFARLSRCPHCGGAMSRRHKMAYGPGGKMTELFLVCMNSENAGPCITHRVHYPPIEELFLKEGPDFLTGEVKRVKEVEVEPSGQQAHHLALLEVRVDEAIKAMRTRPLDRDTLNRCLRSICKRIIVDYPNDRLRFIWRHGGESEFSTAETEYT